MKIYVAGHLGLVGSAIVRAIESSTDHTWVGKSRSELDLFDSEAVHSFIEREKPDAVIVAAARVGGIGANSRFPVDFLVENLRIEVNVLEASHSNNVERLLFLGSSCIYPKLATQPISEQSLLTGPLEPTNEAYALAKIVGVKLVNAYKEQFGRKWLSAMPTNIYGPGDNFDPESGHVLPSLIRKFHDAKVTGDKAVELWGNGSALREFLHADDLARACLALLESDVTGEHVNVGSGDEVTIKDLAGLIQRIVGYEGAVVWDQEKPNGTPRKLLDSSRMVGLNWQAEIALEEGIRLTYESFLNHLTSPNSLGNSALSSGVG